MFNISYPTTSERPNFHIPTVLMKESRLCQHRGSFGWYWPTFVGWALPCQTHKSQIGQSPLFFIHFQFCMDGFIHFPSRSFKYYISINSNSIGRQCLLSIWKWSTLACEWGSHFCHLLVFTNYKASIWRCALITKNPWRTKRYEFSSQLVKYLSITSKLISLILEPNYTWESCQGLFLMQIICTNIWTNMYCIAPPWWNLQGY